MAISFKKIENPVARAGDFLGRETEGERFSSPQFSLTSKPSKGLWRSSRLFGEENGISASYIETKYGLKIVFAMCTKPLLQDELKVLENALSLVRIARPSDVEKIEEIHFIDGEHRGVAATRSGSTIVIVHSFEQTTTGEGIMTLEEFAGQALSKDAFWLYTEADSETFLFHAIAHEIGHLVEPSEFPNFYVDQGYERFAEDYRIYITSGGTKVVRKDLKDNDVPHYDERLSYFKKTYPFCR